MDKKMLERWKQHLDEHLNDPTLHISASSNLCTMLGLHLHTPLFSIPTDTSIRNSLFTIDDPKPPTQGSCFPQQEMIEAYPTCLEMEMELHKRQTFSQSSSSHLPLTLSKCLRCVKFEIKNVIPLRGTISTYRQQPAGLIVGSRNSTPAQLSCPPSVRVICRLFYRSLMLMVWKTCNQRH